MADTIKLSDLTSRFTAVTEDELFETSEYQGVPGDYLSKKVTKSILLGYKSYHNAPSQTGTSAPTSNEFKNDFGGTPSWSYVGPGRYDLTITGAFTANKTIALLSGAVDYTVSAARMGDNVVRLYVDDLSSTGANNILDGSMLLEIRVYY